METLLELQAQSSWYRPVAGIHSHRMQTAIACGDLRGRLDGCKGEDLLRRDQQAHRLHLRPAWDSKAGLADQAQGMLRRAARGPWEPAAGQGHNPVHAFGLCEPQMVQSGRDSKGVELHRYSP